MNDSQRERRWNPSIGLSSSPTEVSGEMKAFFGRRVACGEGLLAFSSKTICERLTGNRNPAMAHNKEMARAAIAIRHATREHQMPTLQRQHEIK